MKNIINIGKALFMVGVLLLAITGCSYDTIVYPEPEIPDTISYGTDIAPIFETNCTASTCHATGVIDPDLTSANSYNSLTTGNYIDTSSPEASIVYIKLSPGGSMEQYANNQERALILAWIKDGAQNN
jgi:uncharacterized membrane protein